MGKCFKLLNDDLIMRKCQTKGMNLHKNNEHLTNVINLHTSYNIVVQVHASCYGNAKSLQIRSQISSTYTLREMGPHSLTVTVVYIYGPSLAILVGGTNCYIFNKQKQQLNKALPSVLDNTQTVISKAYLVTTD